MTVFLRRLVIALGALLTASSIGPAALSAQFSVTPYGAAAPAQSGQVTFTIYNDREVGDEEMDTFELTCDNSGGVSGCRADMYASVWRGSSATTDVSYSVSGSGQLGLTAYDYHEMGSSDRGWYTVTVSAPTVAVTPDGGSVTRTASGSYSETFGVQNTGTQSTTFSFTQLCSGAGVVNRSTPSAVTLAPNASTSVSVSYTAGGGGTGGTVALRASGGGSQDDGSISVTVSPTASVDVWSHAAPILFQPQTADTLSFTIKNTGTVSGEFTLQATCASYALNCQTNLGSVTLAAGVEVSRTVSFTTPIKGQTGAVALRATNVADAPKTDLATTPVRSDGHPQPNVGPPTADPIITVTPAFRKLFGGASTVTVDITWCLPGPGSWQSMVVENEHPDGRTYITSAFDTVHGQSPQPANCSGPNDSWARSTGVVPVREGGLNLITASAYTSGGQYGYGEARFEIIPPHRAVTVIAAGQEAEALPGSSGHVARFTITNDGVATDTFNLAQTCASTATCTSTPPPFVVLGSGSSTEITTTYGVGSTVGQAGLVRLKATHRRDTSVVDSSWTEVTVVPVPTAGVILVGSAGVLERDLCLTAAAGSDAAVECGDRALLHELLSPWRR